VGNKNLNFDRNQPNVLKIFLLSSITGRLWHSVRPGSAVGIATGYGLDEREGSELGKQFIFCISPRPALGPT
jgi:hypothetical protein